LAINDWYHIDAKEHREIYLNNSTPSICFDSMLLNGKWIYQHHDHIEKDCYCDFSNVENNYSTNYEKIDVEEGKIYRIRIIGLQTTISFGINFDGHLFTVIGYCGKYVTNSTVQFFELTPGSTFDIILYANEKIKNYRIRASYWIDYWNTYYVISPKDLNRQLGILSYKDASEWIDWNVTKPIIWDLNNIQNLDINTNCKEISKRILLTIQLNKSTCQWSINGSKFIIPDNPISLIGCSCPDINNPLIIMTNGVCTRLVMINEENQAISLIKHGSYFYLRKLDNNTRWNENDLKNYTLKIPVVNIPANGYAIIDLLNDENKGFWLFRSTTDLYYQNGLIFIIGTKKYE